MRGSSIVSGWGKYVVVAYRENFARLDRMLQVAKLSVVVPAYNEVSQIGSVLRAVHDCGYPNLEIVVIDDGSTDGTSEAIRGELSALATVALFQGDRKGKGAALRLGLEHCTGEFVVIQDADLEYDPAELPGLLESLQKSSAGAVFGSRIIERSASDPWLRSSHGRANVLLTWISNRCTGLSLTDMETCYKMFRRELIDPLSLSEQGFGVEPQVTAILAAAKVDIIEVPVSYQPRTCAEGKKIRWTDGVRTLLVIFACRIRGLTRGSDWSF